MLYLLYGPSDRLLSHCRRHYGDSPHNLQLVPPVGYAPPCSVVRAVLPQIRRLRGDAFVDGVIAEHRVAASLILRRVRETLNDAEEEHRATLVARLDSNMTHNEIAQQALFDACAELLGALVEEGAYCLVIPDLRRLDAASLGILRTLFQQDPHQLDLVLGYDRSRPQAPLDDDGILWEFGPALLDEYVTGFARVTPSIEVDLGATEPAEDEMSEDHPAASPLPVDPLDDDLEARSFRDLTTGSGAPSRSLCADAVAGVVQAFEVQSFRESLKLARALLAREPDLDRDETAVLHATLALAAHNRQFRSKGNVRLGEFLARHTRRALDTATEPALRICLLYRAAVTLSRRLGHPEEADESVEQAFDELAAAPMSASRKTLLEVWLRNIRGYIYMRLGRPGEAAEQTEITYQLLQDLLASLPEDDVRWTEAQLTLAVLADNLVRLSYGRDPAAYQAWMRRTERAVDPWPLFKRLTAREWANLYRDDFDLETAVTYSRHGLRLARSQLAPLMELANMANLADIHDRAGDTATALALFSDAIPLRDRIETVLDSPLALELGEAAAAARLGRIDQAEASLRRLLPADESAEPASAARLWARLGLLAARAGQAEAAEERMNRAIDLAVESGARDLLVEVATASGEASRTLGCSDDAREAFAKALEIAEPAGLDTLHPPVAVTLFRGLHACTDDPAHLVQALRFLPEALVLDAETWWILAPFLEQLSAAVDPEALDAEARDALDRAKKAASQRPDGRRVLQALEDVPAMAQVAG